MATTLTQKRLRTQMLAENPTIDAADPIISDVFINFAANVTDDITTRVADLKGRYTNTYLSNLSDSELKTFAYQLKGLTQDPGKSSSGYVYLMIPVTPAEDVLVAQNSIFSTSDNKWQFYTLSTVYVSLTDLQKFYNPVRGVFELRIPVQAVRTGADFNVAAYRITSIRSPFAFNARVENREPTTGGTDAEAREDFIKRIELAQAGFDNNSTFGVANRIVTQTSASDVYISQITPDANVYDVYVIGIKPIADTYTYTLKTTNERRIRLPAYHQPIRYINNVVFDSQILDAGDYRYSTSELILNPSLNLLPGKVVAIGYQYNQLVQDVKDLLNTDINIAGATWRVKEAEPLELILNIKVKLSTFLTIPEVQEIIIDSLATLLNAGEFVPVVTSGMLEDTVASANSNILEVKIAVNDSFAVEFKPHQYPTLSSDNVTLELL